MSPPLPDHLRETMNLIPRKAFTTAQMLNDQVEWVSPNAFNNRLAALWRLGLVRRERRGRVWRYFRAPINQRRAPNAEQFKKALK